MKLQKDEMIKSENMVWSKFWINKESWLWILRFSPTYKKITGMFRDLDISDVALAITNKKGVKTIKADILEGLPFEDNSFDLVYSDGLLEHFVEPEPILGEGLINDTRKEKI